MIILDIIQIEKYGNYIFKTKEGLIKNLVLGFYGIDNPKIGDKLMIHEDMFDSSKIGYSQPYFFELTKDKTAKEIKEENNREYAALKADNNVISLKRVYG